MYICIYIYTYNDVYFHMAVLGDTYVDKEFGTGALKVTPAHDVNDYAIGKRHHLQMITILNKDGTMNANVRRSCHHDGEVHGV